MKFHYSALLLAVILILLPNASLGQESDSQNVPYAGAAGWAETKAQRMKWFKGAKFGMFIHWGLYAPAGGFWPPNPETGRQYPQHYSEWIRNWANVAEPEYGRLTKPLFQPDEGCMDQWAKIAKAAGMKYTVLTTKHHDGYTLFNSKAEYSKKNDVTGSTNISPAGRDLVAEYSQAVRKQGLKVGYYYSLIDWQHPDAFPHSRKWPIAADADHDRYIAYMHQHIKQLFSDYGPSDILWVDYSSKKYQASTWQTKQLLDEVHKLQPNALINNRFWNGLQNANGDFFTPEKYVPATGYPGRSFEVCHTMNESFGYSHHDKNWKSSKEVIHLLVDIVSKGGNLLLNVGPDANGRIPKESADALMEVGQWLDGYGDAIYGTEASPFANLAFEGRCTRKSSSGGNTNLYFHVFKRPADGRVLLPTLENDVIGISEMKTGQQLSLVKNAQGWFVEIPESMSRMKCPVLKLQISGAPKFDPLASIVQQRVDRSVLLSVDRAEVSGTAIHVLPKAIRRKFAHTSHWFKKDAQVKFAFNVSSPGPVQPGGAVTQQPGKYDVFAEFATATNSGGRLELKLGDQTLVAPVESTGGWDKYERKLIGVVTLQTTGKKEIVLSASEIKGGGFMNLRSLELVPKKID